MAQALTKLMNSGIHLADINLSLASHHNALAHLKFIKMIGRHTMVGDGGIFFGN